MFAPGDIDLAGNVGVQRRLAQLVEIGAGVGDQLGIPVHLAVIDVEQLGILIARAAQDRDLAGPAAAEIVGDVAEQVAVERVPLRPGLRRIGRARVSGGGAVGIGEGQGAPAHAARVAFLPRVADCRDGIRAKIGGGDAVQRQARGVVVVEVGIAVLIGADEAGADRTVLGQRGVDVHIAAHLVVGAVAEAGVAAEVLGRALADEVDGGGRVAGLRQQAGGTAHDIDALEDRGVDLAVLQAVAERLADAVELEVDDVEAARVVISAVGLGAVDVHAGGAAQQGVHGVEAEVLDLGAGDDRNRLRSFTQREIEAGGAALRTDDIVLRHRTGDHDVAVGLLGVGFGIIGMGCYRQQCGACNDGKCDARCARLIDLDGLAPLGDGHRFLLLLKMRVTRNSVRVLRGSGGKSTFSRGRGALCVFMCLLGNSLAAPRLWRCGAAEGIGRHEQIPPRFQHFRQAVARGDYP